MYQPCCDIVGGGAPTPHFCGIPQSRIEIVGANCVRPWARKPRPYKSYARLVRDGRGELRSPVGAETAPQNGGSKPPPYGVAPRWDNS